VFVFLLKIYNFEHVDLYTNQTNIFEMNSAEIFISYAWGGESENMADEMYKVLSQQGFNVIRDKIHLGYKGNIKEFMQRIGRGSAIAVIISDKYLRSPNCMCEIVQIQQNGQLFDRIFPIILQDANIYKPQNRLMYVEHWEKEVRSLNSSMKGIENMALIGEIQQELQEYNQILNAISGITSLLKNTNTLTPEMLRDVAYQPLVDAILQQNEQAKPEKNEPAGKQNNINAQNTEGGIFLQDVNGSQININVNTNNNKGENIKSDKNAYIEVLIHNEYDFFEIFEKQLEKLSDSQKIEYFGLKKERLQPPNNFNPVDWKNRMLVFVRQWS
jgi:hypothetical protein